MLLTPFVGKAQELYVYTEPASNMAAKSVGFRLTNNFARIQGSNQFRYTAAPEVMVAVSRAFMLHGEAFIGNRVGNLRLNGGSLYGKFRFLSKDEVHSHFRMAAYMRASISNLPIHQQAIDLQGMNTGTEAGLVATKLNGRLALSASASHLYAADNADENNFHYGRKNRNAIGYTFSAGRLMLPKEYTSYDQTNINLMTELLGQTNLATGDSFLDLAASLQFIIRSRMRVDVGYRFALIKDLSRTSTDGALVRLEYNIFNAF